MVPHPALIGALHQLLELALLSSVLHVRVLPGRLGDFLRHHGSASFRCSSPPTTSLRCLILAFLHLRGLLLLGIRSELLDLDEPILDLYLRSRLKTSPLDVLRLHGPVRPVSTLDAFGVGPLTRGGRLRAPIVASCIPTFGLSLGVVRSAFDRFRNLGPRQSREDFWREFDLARSSLQGTSSCSSSSASCQTANLPSAPAP